jgi:hypothetical protein
MIYGASLSIGSEITQAAILTPAGQSVAQSIEAEEIDGCTGAADNSRRHAQTTRGKSAKAADLSMGGPLG